MTVLDKNVRVMSRVKGYRKTFGATFSKYLFIAEAGADYKYTCTRGILAQSRHQQLTSTLTDPRDICLCFYWVVYFAYSTVYAFIGLGAVWRNDLLNPSLSTQHKQKHILIMHSHPRSHKWNHTLVGYI